MLALDNVHCKHHSCRVYILGFCIGNHIAKYNLAIKPTAFIASTLAYYSNLTDSSLAVNRQQQNLHSKLPQQHHKQHSGFQQQLTQQLRASRA